MPNPAIHFPDRRRLTAAGEPELESPNGILVRVPGEIISAASDRLPAPTDQVQSPQQVAIEVPSFGRVVITFQAKRYRAHKSTYWHWRAVRADRETDAAANEKKPPTASEAVGG